MIDQDVNAFIRVIGEELINAGMPAGDRTVILANLRALIAECESLREDRDSLREECMALRHVFDLQWKADQRAITLWQAAHPGNDMVWPDRCDMVVWLMEQLTIQRGEI